MMEKNLYWKFFFSFIYIYICIIFLEVRKYTTMHLPTNMQQTFKRKETKISK